MMILSQSVSSSFKALPKIISQVSIGSIDINLSLTLFWSFDLWEGVIMIYNHVLNDYRTPLEKLVEKIGDGGEVVDTILMYLSCSLDGLQYPDAAPLANALKFCKKVDKIFKIFYRNFLLKIFIF